MNLIFKPFLHKFILVFFDYILVYHWSLEQRQEHLQNMLWLLHDH